MKTYFLTILVFSFLCPSHSNAACGEDAPAQKKRKVIKQTQEKGSENSHTTNTQDSFLVFFVPPLTDPSHGTIAQRRVTNPPSPTLIERKRKELEAAGKIRNSCPNCRMATWRQAQPSCEKHRNLFQ